MVCVCLRPKETRTQTCRGSGGFSCGWKKHEMGCNGESTCFPNQPMAGNKVAYCILPHGTFMVSFPTFSEASINCRDSNIRKPLAKERVLWTSGGTSRAKTLINLDLPITFLRHGSQGTLWWRFGG